MKDPIGFGGGQGNLYGYVRNNSLNRIDPLDLSDVIYDSGSSAITIHYSQGNKVGQFPAGNDTASNSTW